MTFADLTQRRLANVTRCTCGCWAWEPVGYCRTCGERWHATAQPLARRMDEAAREAS